MKAYDFSDLDVLVAEDSPQMRAILRAMLSGIGINQHRVCRDGESALRALRDEPADLLITAWEMAPMNGIGLIAAIRDEGRSPCPFLPIMMLTSHTDFESITAARDAGATEFLAKPVTAKALYAHIVKIVTQPRPFIRAKGYFGPDRRRKDSIHPGEDRRKKNTPDAGRCGARPQPESHAAE